MIYFLAAPKYEYSENEKRELQPRPKFTIETLMNSSYGRNFEKYLSDQFPVRKFFVGFDAYFNLFTGRNGSSGIYRGGSNYLISKPVKFNKSSLERNIRKLNSFCESINIPAYMAVIPSTGKIMDKELPMVHLEYKDDKIFQSIINSLSPKISYIDINALFEKNKDKELFYKTDHHWTSLGSYITYTEYCNRLGLNPVNQKDFTKKEYGGFYGTSYSKSALWNTHSDIITIWENPFQNNIKIYIDDGAQGTTTSESLFFYNHLEKMDKYPVFIDGNHGFVKITNDKVNDGRLLIVKDSFAHSIAPFLCANYHEIYLIDPRYYKAPITDIIKNNSVDTLLILYGLDNIVNDTNIVWVK